MSQCARISDSPPSTYPIDTDPINFDKCLIGNTDQPNTSIWGRLIPIATNLNTRVLDLENDTYLFGRQASCDVIFSKENMCDDHIKVISKVHFRINRNQMTSVYVVCLEDLSSNGTYINGDRIEKGRKVPLKNNDVISLALPSVQVFVYTDLKEEEVCYPPEIKRKYTVTRVLGSGACGKVHLVFEKDTSKMFAMKIIQKNKYSSGGINDPKKIKNEVKILKALLHPCVIQIEDFVDAADQFFIILSLAEGGDLMKYITEKQSLSEKETKKIFYQVVLGVQYLHSKGIAHRDLKPQNILLTGRGQDSLVKITDFGLSKTLEASVTGNGFNCSPSWSECGKAKNGLMNTVCGSPLYVAPEILSAHFCSSSGQSDGYTLKVDIWSMGVILYICLSGHPPFLPACEYERHGDESDSDEQCPNRQVNEQKTLLSAIINGEYSFPRKLWQGVTDMAKDLVKKMLTVDPSKRITIEGILNHDWLQDDGMKYLVHSLMDKSPACLQESDCIVGPVTSDLSPRLKRRKTTAEEC